VSNGNVSRGGPGAGQSFARLLRLGVLLSRWGGYAGTLFAVGSSVATVLQRILSTFNINTRNKKIQMGNLLTLDDAANSVWYMFSLSVSFLMNSVTSINLVGV
jgi:hypothetical protein